MNKFTTLTATACPLRAENVDTDQIIPARYLTTVTRTGLGKGLFADWRVDANGQPRPDFPLNQPQYAGAAILLAGRNFGCGSSREHAPWAIMDAGFAVVISSYFADIFYNNSLKNGLLLAVLTPAALSELFDRVEERPSTLIRIDLPAQTVTVGNHVYVFEIDPYRKLCLVEGLDDLSYLLHQETNIATYEQQGSALLDDEE
ncbi:3-isopropylmalate dehydratase small subunit [Candidatus Amarolinea aalborgensis]|uniref:3-isopropylmalate dehydratase small subunit n=1 Tax=Candidatus Amarolinea aalborgensis TaxID=2249329 RepID=UPI003BF96E63